MASWGGWTGSWDEPVGPEYLQPLLEGLGWHALLPLSNPIAMAKRAASDPEYRERAREYVTEESAPAIGAKAAWEGLTPPGDVAKGEVDPFSEEAGQRVWDLILTSMVGGSPFVPSASAGVLGGRLGRGFPRHKVAQAERMETQGASPYEIWRDTGLERGHDRKWRYEIPDTEARVTRDTRPSSSRMAPLSELWDHPQLFDEYPQIANVSVEYGNPAMPMGAGQMSPSKHGAGRPGIDIAPMLADRAEPILGHEVQHLVQEMEGFYPGTNPQYQASRIAANHPEIVRRAEELAEENFKSPLWMVPPLIQQEYIAQARRDLGQSLYHLQSGEVEARNVAGRKNFSEKELRHLAPSETEDVPRASQLPMRLLPPSTRQEYEERLMDFIERLL